MTPASHREVVYPALIQSFKIIPVEYRRDRTGNGAAIIEQHAHMIAEMAFPGGAAPRHYDSLSPSVQLPEQRHRAHLVAQIEILQRFVKQQALRRLGKQQCNTR